MSEHVKSRMHPPPEALADDEARVRRQEKALFDGKRIPDEPFTRDFLKFDTVPGDTPVAKARWLANAALEELDEGNDVTAHLEGIEKLLEGRA